MHFIQSIAVASSLLTVTTYANPLTRRDRFSVQTTAKNGKMSGQKAMLKVYKKYGKSIPARIKAGTSSNGSVTATPSKGDQEYDAQVVIGGQTFNLDFDTGSSDL